MKLRTNEQNARFHVLLTQRKFDKEEKAELVYLVSQERTRSSAELTEAEMQVAIDRLEAASTSSTKKMRAKIYHIARDIFGLDSKAKFEQQHYDAVDKVMLKTFKAKLWQLPYETLPMAVTVMENWRKSATKKMVNDILNGV